MHRWHLGSDRFGQLKADAAKARLRSSKGLAIVLAAGGLVLLFTCNPFVKKPSVPVVTGPDVGVVGIPLEFKATSTDPNGDSVAFMFDWGDTTTKVWTDFVLSGETLSVSHTYAESSNYAVKAKAQNGKGTESSWSDGHSLQLTGAGPGYPDSLVASILMPIQDLVHSEVVTPDGRFLYIAPWQDQRLLVLRTSDNVFLNSVTVGDGPWKIVLSPDGSRLYVTTSGCDSVKVLSLPDNSEVASVRVGRQPRAMVGSPDGERLYVANTGEDSVACIRVSDFSVEKKIHTDSIPNGLAIDPSGNVIYVSSFLDTTVTSYSTTTWDEIGKLKVSIGLTGMAATKSGEKLYVGNASGQLFVIPSDLSRVSKTIELFGVIDAPIFSPDGFYAFVATDEHHGLPVVRTDNDETAGWIQSPNGLYGAVAVAPDFSQIYAVDDYRGRLNVYRRRAR